MGTTAQGWHPLRLDHPHLWDSCQVGGTKRLWGLDLLRIISLVTNRLISHPSVEIVRITFSLWTVHSSTQNVCVFVSFVRPPVVTIAHDSRCISLVSRRRLTFSACGQVAHIWFRCGVSPIMASGANGVLLPKSKSQNVSFSLALICHHHHNPASNPDHKLFMRFLTPHWSTSYLPDFHQEKLMWIMVIIFSAIIVFIVTCLLHANSHRYWSNLCVLLNGSDMLHRYLSLIYCCGSS